MNLDRMLSIVSCFLGFSGSIFLAMGVLKLTPDIIAKQCKTYCNWNEFQLENIVSQKADFLCGIVLITFAFFIQLANLSYFHNYSQKPVPSYLVYVIGLVGVLILTGTYFLIKPCIIKKFKFETHIILEKQRLQEVFKYKKIGKVEYESLLRETKRFFSSVFEEKEGEAPMNFLKRYSEFLGVDIPADIDLSEL